MSARPAGRRYPHVTTAARDPDHRYCPVLDAVRARVAAGAEPWGRVHELGVATEEDARDAKQGLYRARNHTSARRGACGTEPLSIKAGYQRAGKQWVVTLQVWDRATAKKEIVRRVRDGEQLAYNVRRDT